MELNKFFSLVVGVISFAVILYISDLVVTRIFSRLDDDLAKSNFDEDTKRKKINLIIAFSIVILIGMIVLVNVDLNITKIAATKTIIGTIKISSPEISQDLAQTETQVLISSQEPDTTSRPSHTPTPVIDSDLKATQKAAEETAKARNELATKNAQATQNAQETQTAAEATAFAEAIEKTIEAGDSLKVIARKTSRKELDDILSIWIAYGLNAEIESGIYNKSYKIPILSSDRYHLPFNWCATNKTLLSDNLDEMSVEYLIDGEKISDSLIGLFEYKVKDKNVNWECRKWSTTLSDWKPGSEVELAINVVFNKDLFDGKSNYSKGTYTLGLIVSTSK